MSYKVVNFTHISDTADPAPGHRFMLEVILDRPVEDQDGKVMINLEKQRVLISVGGAPDVRPTGPDYFEQKNTGGSIDSDLGPIVIYAGKDKGATGPIIVRKDAKSGTGETSVVFPEQLLFTAFFGDDNPPVRQLFRCHPVYILRAVRMS